MLLPNGRKKMTNEQIIEIHLNNSDLNIKNLAAIHNSDVSTVAGILAHYYCNKPWAESLNLNFEA